MIRTLVIVLLVFLFSCVNNKSEFKKVTHEISYKYLKFGEGPRIEKGKKVMLYLSVLDELGDTLHYVPDFPYFIEINDHPLDSALSYLGEGDSAHIKLPRKSFNTYLKFYEPLQVDTGEVELRVSIKNVLKANDADMLQKRMLSERELNEQLELKGYLKSLQDSVEYYDGIYRIKLDETDGELIEYGDQVSISYKGMFLDSYVFDDTRDKEITPTFRYGEEYQLIEGVSSGLKGVREGESVKIILPSRRAFGEEGSLAGIVPPYTTVIFEIKVLKIEK